MIPAHNMLITELYLRKPLLCGLLALALWTNVTQTQGLDAILSPDTPASSWSNGALATVHPLASEMGIRAFREGGNAVDASIAAALVLGVVDSHNSGIGGGCFILIRRECGDILAIDGREMAPAASHRDMYLIDGKLDPMASQQGALAPGVPGALMAYHEAVSRYGKLSFSDLLNWAAEIAETGFPVDESFAARTAAERASILKFPSTAKILLQANQQPYKAGDLLKQPELAATYRAIASHGVSWFYQGQFADSAAQWMNENGGIMTREDFENYEIQYRQPISTQYRGHEIIGFPPPSSGGVHVAQILSLMESSLPDCTKTGSASWYHYLTESMRLAFADRAHWLGDPDFYPIPVNLVDSEYLKTRSKLIQPDQALDSISFGTPSNFDSEWFGNKKEFPGLNKHTTHLSAADKDGVWVALTTTLNTWYGSLVTVPGTGVLLNNQMDDFSAQPGKPNYFGLVGAEANSIQPGKRPLSSMSPTLVLKDGSPLMSLGAAGGPTIITQVVQAVIWSLDQDLSPKEALSPARIHHQWLPSQLLVESQLDKPVQEELQSMGHKVELRNGLGATQLVRWNEKLKVFQASADPRGDGKALGW